VLTTSSEPCLWTEVVVQRSGHCHTGEIPA
jgi:hypothetical protein